MWDDQKSEKHSRQERIGKKDRRDRRPKKSEIVQTDFVLKSKDWKKKQKSDWFVGRVVEVQKKYIFIAQEKEDQSLEMEEFWLGTMARRHLLADRTQRNFVTVGDRVMCRPDGLQDNSQEHFCVIEHRMSRRNEISRNDPLNSRQQHVIASNLDQLVVVASFLLPEVKWRLIDRYIVLAEQQGLPVLIFLNKLDLFESADEAFKKRCEEYITLYRDLGYGVQKIQVTKDKPQPIRKHFSDKTSLIVGHSGVGKSSLVNLLLGDEAQEVEMEKVLSKGRHTTSFSAFLELKEGSYLIDTPGVRGLDIGFDAARELAFGFLEFREPMLNCQFRGCKHLEEPGCAVLQAVVDGKISRARYDSYRYLVAGENEVNA